MINNMNGMYMPNFQYGLQGYQTMQSPKLPNMNNVLKPEQQRQLQQNSYSLQLTPEQIWRASCTHKAKGNFATRQDPTSSNPKDMECTVCKTRFTMIDDPIDVTSAHVNYVVNMVNTIQTVGIELPEQFLLESGKLKAVLGMLPEIHNVVMKTWDEKYSKSNYANNNAGSNSMALYNYMINGGPALSNPNIMQQNLMQQGMMGTMAPYYQQQAMYNQQPMGMQQQQYYQQPASPQPMGWQQPAYSQPPMSGGMPQMNMGTNMNMNYPGVNTQSMNNNSFFQDNSQPAYSQPPMGTMQQQTMQEPSKPAQTFQPPTGAVKDDKVEEKAMATKPIQP